MTDKNFEAKALDDAELDQVNGGIDDDTYAKANTFYRDFRRNYCSKCKNDGAYNEYGRSKCSNDNPVWIYMMYSEENNYLNGGKCHMFAPKA